jgi:hypothetical protein
VVRETKVGRNAWSSDGEPPLDFFDEKSIIYEGMIDLVPTRSERSRVIGILIPQIQWNGCE